MKKAVHFGAGNIGRGFLGQLYFESGYETTFIDVADALIAGLNERRAYPLRILDEVSYTMLIENVRAVDARKTDEAAAALAEAEIASTAVGVSVLPRIAPVLAAGIARRFADANAKPLDIIVCENLLEAGPFLREEVRKTPPRVSRDSGRESGIRRSEHRADGAGDDGRAERGRPAAGMCRGVLPFACGQGWLQRVRTGIEEPSAARQF